MIWWVLDKISITRCYVDIIKDLYERMVTSVTTTYRVIDEFLVTISLHQGTTFSPYLFALIMDKLSTHIPRNIPWCMLFIDNIVLVDESRDDVNAKIEKRPDALESKGFKISHIRWNI